MYVGRPLEIALESRSCVNLRARVVRRSGCNTFRYRVRQCRDVSETTACGRGLVQTSIFHSPRRSRIDKRLTRIRRRPTVVCGGHRWRATRQNRYAVRTSCRAIFGLITNRFAEIHGFPGKNAATTVDRNENARWTVRNAIHAQKNFFFLWKRHQR